MDEVIHALEKLLALSRAYYARAIERPSRRTIARRRLGLAIDDDGIATKKSCVRVLCQHVHAEFTEPRHYPVVRTGKNEILSPRERKTCPQSCVGPGIHGLVDYHDPRRLCGQFVDDREAVIGRGVVYNDDLVRRAFLGEQRVHSPANVPAVIVMRDDGGEDHVATRQVLCLILQDAAATVRGRIQR